MRVEGNGRRREGLLRGVCMMEVWGFVAFLRVGHMHGARKNWGHQKTHRCIAWGNGSVSRIEKYLVFVNRSFLCKLHVRVGLSSEQTTRWRTNAWYVRSHGCSRYEDTAYRKNTLMRTKRPEYQLWKLRLYAVSGWLKYDKVLRT